MFVRIVDFIWGIILVIVVFGKLPTVPIWVVFGLGLLVSVLIRELRLYKL